MTAPSNTLKQKADALLAQHKKNFDDHCLAPLEHQMADLIAEQQARIAELTKPACDTEALTKEVERLRLIIRANSVLDRIDSATSVVWPDGVGTRDKPHDRVNPFIGAIDDQGCDRN